MRVSWKEESGATVSGTVVGWSSGHGRPTCAIIVTASSTVTQREISRLLVLEDRDDVSITVDPDTIIGAPFRGMPSILDVDMGEIEARTMAFMGDDLNMADDTIAAFMSEQHSKKYVNPFYGNSPGAIINRIVVDNLRNVLEKFDELNDVSMSGESGALKLFQHASNQMDMAIDQARSAIEEYDRYRILNNESS